MFMVLNSEVENFIPCFFQSCCAPSLPIKNDKRHTDDYVTLDKTLISLGLMFSNKTRNGIRFDDLQDPFQH